MRDAAIWIFSLLYEVPEVERILDEHVLAFNRPVSDLPDRDDLFDAAIDDSYGVVQVAGIQYLTSELLHAVDPRAYKELALELLESRTTPVSAA